MRRISAGILKSGSFRAAQLSGHVRRIKNDDLVAYSRRPTNIMPAVRSERGCRAFDFHRRCNLSAVRSTPLVHPISGNDSLLRFARSLNARPNHRHRCRPTRRRSRHDREQRNVLKRPGSGFIGHCRTGHGTRRRIRPLVTCIASPRIAEQPGQVDAAHQRRYLEIRPIPGRTTYRERSVRRSPLQPSECG